MGAVIFGSRQSRMGRRRDLERATGSGTEGMGVVGAMVEFEMFVWTVDGLSMKAGKVGARGGAGIVYCIRRFVVE